MDSTTKLMMIFFLIWMIPDLVKAAVTLKGMYSRKLEDEARAY